LPRESDDVSKPVLHAATFPLPEGRGDFGSRAVEVMGPQDVFISLLEYGDEAVNSALFSPGELPHRIDPERFGTNRLQRWIPNQAGYQDFFTQDGRAFCLYIVIGNYSNREPAARQASQLLAALKIESAFPEGIQ
jgi:hypothetical protein